MIHTRFLIGGPNNIHCIEGLVIFSANEKRKLDDG